MSEGNNKMRVPCNNKVKAYNTQHLSDIAAMSVSEVYNSVSASGGIITKKAATCKKRIESLIQKIAEFKPSVPMTREEQQKVDNMLQVWSAQLHRQLSAVSIPVKPTYLRDTVTQILQSKGVNEPCTNRHLEWYLVRYNAKQLIPAEIADAIIQHRGSKWDSMPHLVRDAEYNINVADSNKSEGQKTRRKEENFLRIRDAFEFIESFPATPGIDTLDARLANDITVADMVLSWRKKSITRYDDYMTIFQMFVNSLQTLPDDARQVTFADTTEKATDPKKKGKANTKKSKAKSKKGKKENTSPTPPEQPSVEEDPGEEPENLTPEDFVHAEHSTDSAFPSELERQKNVHQNNHTELISYLKSIASRTFYLERNLTEGKNPEYIEKFASRADFRDLFNTLKQHTAEGTYAQAKTIMQFIRNVANYNILEWGAPAPGQ
nr:hypothetical protein [uncultured Prevotella sp.]